MNRITGYDGVVHIGMLPKTILGKWSANLAIAFVIALVVFIVLRNGRVALVGSSLPCNPMKSSLAIILCSFLALDSME